MKYGFYLKTSDPEEFQEQIAPLSGSCQVRPAKGTHFDITARAERLDKLGLFIVKAPSLKVHIAPPHEYFCVNIPLGKPFLAIESNRSCLFSDDVHLVMPDRHMRLEAVSEMRVLAVKLDSERVFDDAFKLSGSCSPFRISDNNRLPHSTTALSALSRDIAALWSDLQRRDASLTSAINIAEREDALFTRFVLATQGDEKTRYRSREQADTKSIARAEEYLCAHLTLPVSRAELAAVTGLSIRTLSRGFTKRWGTGPMGFLKTLRMEAAYRELLGTTPGATSVTEVACQYGFTHLGRFAGEYKGAFHESPSETLRH
jgi:AraC-like DNA-binding protein